MEDKIIIPFHSYKLKETKKDSQINIWKWLFVRILRKDSRKNIKF